MNLKIGVVSFKNPGQSATDRFRFDPLVRGLSNLGYNTAYLDPGQADYDVIILPLKKKPTLFPQIKQKNAMVIGDITDDMLSYPIWYNRWGRLLRLLEKKHQRRYYIDLLRQCDGVVAGSAGQADSFQNYARRVAVIPDAILDSDAQIAAGYVEQNPCRLAWFGNVESLHGLATLPNVLDRLAATGKYTLHLLTSAETKFRLVGKWPHNVYEFMSRQRIPCRFHRWTATTYAQTLAGCHIALVPVEAGTNYNRRKPAGRVLLAMALGLPVVASPIPAYRAVIQQGQTGYIARTPDEWIQFVEQLAHHPAHREAIGRAARRFVLNNYNEQVFVQRYSSVIQQVLA